MTLQFQSKPESLTLAQLLSTFAFAADLAFGLELEDGVRACYIADRIAERLELPPDERLAAYYTSLLKDAGCTCFTSQLADFWQTDEIVSRRDLLIFGSGATLSRYLSWAMSNIGPQMSPLARMNRILLTLRRSGSLMREGYENATEVCVRLIGRLGLPAAVQEAAANLLEQWDGKGFPRGIKGNEIPIAAQIIFPTYFLAPVHRAAGREAACQVARRARGKAFAPDVVDAFLELAEDDDFWVELESPYVWQHVLNREPETHLARVDAGQIDAVAGAFADFIDLKSPYTAAHSRRVAQITEQIARLMRCSEEEVASYRRAGLLHDLGLVAVASRILDKPEAEYSESDQEAVRLHPYYGERILGRVPNLSELLPLVGAHHERVDGNGYFRGMRGHDIPLGARIIAVANRLDELTHDAPGVDALELPEALEVLTAEAGDSLDAEIVQELCRSLGAGGDASPRRAAYPAGLTDREVEVLRLVTRGLTRKEVANRLAITENTVRHHLEHIYGKTGVTTRAGITLFAMENDLLS